MVDEFLTTISEGSEIPASMLLNLVGPESEVRLYRNIPYRPKKDKSLDGDDRPDIIFAVNAILRFDTAYWQELESDPELYTENLRSLYSILFGRISAWYAVACDIYDGFEEPEENDERFQVAKIPARLGDTTISIYGTMIDPKGRSVTVTLTENTTLGTLYQKAVLALGVYDEITQNLAGGEDMNNFFQGGFFQAYTKLDKKGSPNTSKPTQARQRFVPNDDDTNTGSVVSRPKQNTGGTASQIAPVHIETIEQLRSQVEMGAKFSIPIGMIRYVGPSEKNDGVYYFYAYTDENPDGSRQIDTDNGIFIFRQTDNNFFAKFEQQMRGVGAMPNADEEIVVDDILLTAWKKESKNGNVWYNASKVGKITE